MKTLTTLALASCLTLLTSTSLAASCTIEFVNETSGSLTIQEDNQISIHMDSSMASTNNQSFRLSNQSKTYYGTSCSRLLSPDKAITIQAFSETHDCVTSGEFPSTDEDPGQTYILNIQKVASGYSCIITRF